MTHPIVASLKPNPEQIPAITHRGADLAVTAGAGTGKTLTLVGRYLSLLADGMQPRQIAAITFTRKAAHEMRNRVRQTIDNYLRGPAATEPQEWRRLYEALDAARIGTIHSLCAEILRAHPAEAGIDPRFALLTEAEGAILKADAVHAAMVWASARQDGAELFTLFGERQLHSIVAAMLDDRPGASAAFNAMPSGVIAHWHDCLRAHQRHGLQKALEEDVYRRALAALRANTPAADDDLMALQRAAALQAIAACDASQTFEAQREALQQLDAIDLRGGRQHSWPGGKEQLQEVRSALGELRDWWRGHAALFSLELNASDAALAAALPSLCRLAERAEASYVRALRARRLLDFDDLEAMALRLLRDHDDVCNRWRNEIRALLVDEYQDTNARQRDLLNLINGDEKKLFIVGDAKQSIYRFRGAQIAVFRHERARIARSGRALHLSTSYRAHERLVQALNALLEPVLGEPGAHLEAWQEPFSPLVAARNEPGFGFAHPYVEVHLTSGSKGKGALKRAARILASRLLELKEAGNGALRFSDIAILCQASTSFADYEDALDAAAIPYVTVAGRGFFERPEIRDLLNALQAIAHPHDDLALVGFLRSPASGLSDGELLTLADLHRELGSMTLWQTVTRVVQATDYETLKRAVDLLSTLHSTVGRLTVAEILKAFLDETAYLPALHLAGQVRALRNVEKLLEIAYTSAFVSSEDFLQFISQLRSGIAREGEARAMAENAVQIMTVHQAKGLEFPVVVIGDISYQSTFRGDHILDDDLGLVARVSAVEGESASAYTLAKLFEERQQAAESARLLYVAATRARDKLILNGLAATDRTGRLSTQRGWLQMLDAALGLSKDPVRYDEEGTRRHTLDLDLNEHVCCHIYEPHHAVLQVSHQTDRQTPAAAEPSGALVGVWENGASSPEEASPDRVWRVLPQRGTLLVPPRLLGKLVHEALNNWQFPSALDDRAFLESVRMRVPQLGIIDPARLESTAQKAAALLFRFRAHRLYETIAHARRRLHEVPFSRTVALPGTIEVGKIDLLYENHDGWHIVDFKTDAIYDPEELTERLQNAYIPQLKRYREAVEQLLGVTPNCLLCLLDYQGAVRVLDLEPGQA